MLNLNLYVWGLWEAGLIPRQVATKALEVCRRLVCRVPGTLMVPDVSHGPNGELFLIWRKAPHYLSARFARGEAPEFFYRNDATGEIRGLDAPPTTDPLPADLLGKLSLFLEGD